MRYTVTAISARLMLNRLVQAMFAPREVPGNFIPALSREMMVRPIQLRANAEDATFMAPQAKASSERHHELRMRSRSSLARVTFKRPYCLGTRR